MHRAADSVDADPSDVERIEREIDDQQVRMTVVDAKNDQRIIVDADRRQIVRSRWDVDDVGVRVAYTRGKDPLARLLNGGV